jgi:peptidoglycan hydrolase FlgJ
MALSPLDPMQLAPAPQRVALPSANLAPDEMRRAAEQFEAMVLKELLAPIFENLDTEGLGGGGFGEQMFRPMLIDQYAAGMARTGGVGIADAILKELVRMQEAAAPANTEEAGENGPRS